MSSRAKHCYCSCSTLSSPNYSQEFACRARRRRCELQYLQLEERDALSCTLDRFRKSNIFYLSTSFSNYRSSSFGASPVDCCGLKLSTSVPLVSRNASMGSFSGCSSLGSNASATFLSFWVDTISGGFLFMEWQIVLQNQKGMITKLKECDLLRSHAWFIAKAEDNRLKTVGKHLRIEENSSASKTSSKVVFSLL